MDKNRHIDIMGVVNLTDDSFYAGSRVSGVNQTMERVDCLIQEGASIIDIGACSTKPGSLPVGVDQEWKKLSPVLSEIRASHPDAVISIDTYWSEIVSRTYDLIGDFIVNDITSSQADPLMLQVVGELKLKYIAMHMRGMPDNMQSLAEYDDVTSEVLTFFKSFEESAEKYGVKNWVVDPGFGFAKTIEQNYDLLSNLNVFKSLNRPLLVGVSRKSMIYKLLNISSEDSLAATQVVHLAALQNGADILRVHDVAETVQTLKLYRAL